jgi:hypothetical protein
VTPYFRPIALSDIPAGVIKTNNTGSGSGLDADKLDGQDGLYYLNRTNHIGTQPFATLSGTPTSKAGYGILDVPTYSDLSAHAALTSGVHGITHVRRLHRGIPPARLTREPTWGSELPQPSMSLPPEMQPRTRW